MGSGQVPSLSAWLLCRRLIAFRRRAWPTTWRSQSYNRGFCLRRRRCRLRSCTAKCPGTRGHHAKCGRTWHWHVLDGHAQVTDRTGTGCAMEDGHDATARCNAGCRPPLHVCSAERQRWGHVRASSGDAPFPTRFVASAGEPGPDRTVQSSALSTGSLSKQGATQSSMTG